MHTGPARTGRSWHNVCVCAQDVRQGVRGRHSLAQPQRCAILCTPGAGTGTTQHSVFCRRIRLSLHYSKKCTHTHAMLVNILTCSRRLHGIHDVRIICSFICSNVCLDAKDVVLYLYVHSNVMFLGYFSVQRRDMRSHYNLPPTPHSAT